MTDDEIRRLWEACATQNPHVCAWFRLRLVTAQRGGELLQMRWQDIDARSHFWTIPAEFVKNAHGHRAYLNETARDIIKDVPRDDRAVWVFPKSVMGDYKHVGRRIAQPTRASRPAYLRPAGEAEGSTRQQAFVDRLVGQCERVGPALKQCADAALAACGVRAIRLIQGVLGLTRHPRERILAAVTDAYAHHHFRYQTIRRLVERTPSRPRPTLVADDPAIRPMTQYHAPPPSASLRHAISDLSQLRHRGGVIGCEDRPDHRGNGFAGPPWVRWRGGSA